MIDHGFEVSVTVDQDTGNLGIRGELPPEYDPEKHPEEHDKWAAKMSATHERCMANLGFYELQTAYQNTFWVNDSAERSELWSTFVRCIKAAGMPAPSPTVAEYPIGRALLAAVPGKEAAIESCKDQTRGLWPTRTMTGDPRTTIIGTGK